MELHCLQILFSLSLKLMIANAALTPRLYWETMLPSTPMPKAITELLSLGEGDVSKLGDMQMLKNDDQLQSRSIFEYNGTHTTSGEDVSKEHMMQMLKSDDDQSQSKALLQYAGMHNTKDEDVSKGQNMQIFKSLFFLEEEMRAGKILHVQFNNTKHIVPLLPRQISQRIPFSLDKKKQVLERLRVNPSSKNAEIIAETIGLCEEPPTDGERKRCATSLESMVDFVISTFGNNVGAFSTEKERKTESEKFLVEEVRRLGDDKVIACHPLSYPYVVFGCHEVPKSSGYLLRLEGEDGVRVKAVVACHRDTSKWNPNLVAFKVLNVKPGNGTVCHVFREGNLLWLPM